MKRNRLDLTSIQVTRAQKHAIDVAYQRWLDNNEDKYITRGEFLVELCLLFVL